MAILVTTAATSAPRIVPAATNAPPPAAAGDWQKLFADEAWYQRQAGDEQVFTGTLEALPPPAISIRMRHALYKLGSRELHTGARRVPALEALTGKKVDIRGKAVDLALEGQQLREIWPAAVRAAAGGAATP